MFGGLTAVVLTIVVGGVWQCVCAYVCGGEQQNHQHQPFCGDFILKFAKFIIEIKLA